MKQHADYISSVIPEPFRALGLSLRPFCLGHLLVLSRIDSPFVTGGEVEERDVLLAALICSLSFEGGCELISTADRMAQELARIRSKLRRGLFRSIPIAWQEATAMLRTYFEDGMRKADVWNYDDDGQKMTAPWQEIVSIAVARSGWTETQILNTYLPRLMIRYYSILELKMFESAKSSQDIRRVFVTEEEHAAMNRRKSDGESR